MEPFLSAYVDEFNKDSETKLSVGDLQNEIDCHKPYLLTQTILFYSVLGIPLEYIGSIIDALDSVLKRYADGTCKSNWNQGTKSELRPGSGSDGHFSHFLDSVRNSAKIPLRFRSLIGIIKICQTIGT